MSEQRDDGPGGPAGVDRPRVVVGADDSPGGRDALVAGLVEAARRGAVVEAVHAVQPPVSFGGPYPVPSSVWPEVRERALLRTQDLVRSVRADPAVAAVPGAAEVPVTVHACSVPAAERLVGRAHGAELLVVGNRGRGAVGSVLLGSVALHCATHAPCPVLVVHPAPPGAAGRRVVVGLDGSGHARAALAAALDAAAARACRCAWWPPSRWPTSGRS
ncbi:universal stress protein [Modestobacter sp. NPDC049651]|uniref:universal stress protein n=1 Tax=unclassified Modestobacter TaxID=2643866 RepID=UPI0033D4F094